MARCCARQRIQTEVVVVVVWWAARLAPVRELDGAPAHARPLEVGGQGPRRAPQRQVLKAGETGRRGDGGGERQQGSAKDRRHKLRVWFVDWLFLLIVHGISSVAASEEVRASHMRGVEGADPDSRAVAVADAVRGG